MKLSVCLIVKNEEKMLPKCLQSVQQADEIIIVDTGSTDKTIEIALQHTPHVFTDYTWNDNFAEARNHAISKATGDWILTIDADDRLEPGGINKIRTAIKKHPNEYCLNIQYIAEIGSNSHNLPVLYRKCDEVFWVGAIHNSLSKIPNYHSDTIIYYGHSPAHANDPNRALRILQKEVKKNPKQPRMLYYLAREYYYRREYLTASNILRSYLNLSTFLEEKADAWLMLARCLWQMRKGDDARVACLNAIGINANFKEAVLFMAELSWEHNAKTWRMFAESCTNENVLFIR